MRLCEQLSNTDSEGAVIYKSCTRFATNIIVIGPTASTLCFYRRCYDGQMHVIAWSLEKLYFINSHSLLHAKA